MRMVEKVANAIFENMPSDLIGEKTIERVRVSYGIAIASAAIEAVRLAIIDADEGCGEYGCGADRFADMIDKAIQESGE